MSGRNGGASPGDSDARRADDTPPASDGGDDATTHDRSRSRTDGDREAADADRWLGAGVAAFVAVHLLAILVLDGLALPALAGVEAVAVGLLLAGDAAAVGRRAALPAATGALAAVVGVGAALGPAGLRPWVVAVGLLAIGGALLYAGRRYDRYLTGGGPA